jgi:subtilase family serine protease
LVPSNLKISTAYLNTSNLVTVTINNIGGINAGEFSVKLYDGSTQVFKKILSGLAAGASTLVNFTWNPTTTGLHNLKVKVDANYQITESNEANNEITQSATVISGPDLTPSNLQVPSNIPLNAITSVIVTVSNIGGADAGTYSVRLFDGTTQIGKQQPLSLAAGASSQFTFNWKPTTTGIHNLRVVIDQANLVAESNEANNEITTNVNVGNVDLEPTELNVQSSNLNQNNIIQVTVANNGSLDAGTYSVRLFDGETQIGKLQPLGLAAGTSAQFTFNWKPTVTGTHNLKVVIDRSNLIAESNEANNEATQQISVL